MEYINLGRTALRVSRLCLGTMNFGPVTSEIDGRAIMSRALDLGINFFDTADVYGRKRGEGVTENIIGGWLVQDTARRERVVLATKVGGRMGDGPNDHGLSARHIVSACEASLRRLRTDHIDLYQMHHVDRSAPWEEIWQAMDLLVDQGKVRYVGSSNFAGWHIATCQAAADRRHGLGLVSEQSHYNLMTRHAELEVLPAAQAHGMAVFPWSPLAGGALSGALAKVDSGAAGRSASESIRATTDAHHDQLRSWESFCRELGHRPAEVAIAWLLAQPAVTAPIIGPRTIEQLEASMSSFTVDLDEAALATLDEIFPPIGNGGPAPEAWAW